MRVGIGIGLNYQRPSFNPAALFSVAGSRGFFYDFSDYSTQFTDTAGTTAITGVGQSLGLVLDKSAGLTPGPELVTNGDFSSGTTGWTPLAATLSVVSGALRITATTSGLQANAYTSISTIAGRSYKVTATLVADAATGNSFINAGTTAGSGNILSASIGSTLGTYSYVFTATGTTTFISVSSSTAVIAGETLDWDNVSVKEVPGNHATQATAGSRPLTTTIGTGYRGVQFDGVDDFLQTAAIDFAGAEVLGSELVSNGTFGTGDLTGWTTAHTAPSTVSVVAGVATWSTDGVNAARIRQSFTTVVGRTYTVSCAGAGVSVSIGTTAGGAEIVALATNNSRPAFTFVATSTTTWLNTTTATNGATLDNVSVREVLIPADKMTVVAGVRKLSDAARGMVAELTNAATGRFALEAPQGAAANYGFASGGSTPVTAASAATFAAPDTSVLTGVGDIATDTLSLRRNGTQIATSAADQGTGNYANDIVYIGRRGGTSLPFNGILTFLCVINRTLTAGELAALEAYANSRTGAY